MSLFGAMTSGVSGLSAQSSAMGAIADNITNVNTVGYKQTHVDFQTLVTQQASQTRYSAGGVQARPQAGVAAQGLLQGSTSQTDLAISGDGFFLVNEASVPGGNDQYLYTRAGSFKPDAQGYLRNTAGYYLQGWPTDALGDITLPSGSTAGMPNQNIISPDFLETVNLNRVNGTAAATTRIGLGANLPAADAIGTTHGIDVQFFDTLGNAHAASFTFTKLAANQWSLSVAPPPGATTVTLYDAAGNVYDPANAAIDFATDGTPAVFGVARMSVTGFTNGAGDMDGTDSPSVSLDFGTVGQNNGMTQFGSGFSPTFIEQDGARFGNFSGVDIGEDGLVYALFENGERRPIYRLPAATFTNPDGLAAVGGNAWHATEESGNPTLRQADDGRAGRLVQSSLESSTVDIGDEFTRMIVVQRAYSAATRIISTADEMLEELVRIKR
jgi:flagellar hook protein FlgE